MDGSLVLVSDGGLMRHALAGRTVRGGDVVQLCCSGGWLTGRYEWSGALDRAPDFHFSIELGAGRVSEQSLSLPEGALLRWP